MSFKSLFSFSIVGLTVLLMGFFILSPESRRDHTLVFGVSADYPPFESYNKDTLVGFDIDLARSIAQHFGKEAVFQDMPFPSLFIALENGSIDAVISAISPTEDRISSFDFSQPYYYEGISLLYRKDRPLNEDDLQNPKTRIAVQIGSTSALWLSQNYPHVQSVLISHNNEAIESLKAQHVDAVLVGSLQAKAYQEHFPSFGSFTIGHSEGGCAIAVAKNSAILEDINTGLDVLKESGAISELENKWFLGVDS